MRRTFFSFACLLIAAAFAACARAELPEKSLAAMELGLAAARTGGYAQAIRHFETARATAPESPEILLNLALAEARMPGRELRALTWFGAYLAAYPIAEHVSAVRSETAQFRSFLPDPALTSPIRLAEIANSKAMEPVRAALAALAESKWENARLHLNAARLGDPANAALRRADELARWTLDQRRRLDETLGKLDESQTARMLLARNQIALFQEILRIVGSVPPAADQARGERQAPAQNELGPLLIAARRGMAEYFADQAIGHIKIGDLPTALAFFDLAAKNAPETLRYDSAADAIRSWIERMDALPDAGIVRQEIARLQTRNREDLARLIEAFREASRGLQLPCIELKLFFQWVEFGDAEKAMEAANAMPASCHADGGGWGAISRLSMERIALERRLEGGDMAGARRQVAAMSGAKDWAEVEIEMAVLRARAWTGDFAPVYRAADALLGRYPAQREAIMKHMQRVQGIKAHLLDPSYANARPTLCRWDCSRIADWTNLVAGSDRTFGDIRQQLSTFAAGKGVHIVAFDKMVTGLIASSNAIDRMLERQAELRSRRHLAAAEALRRYVAENAQASAAYDERYKVNP